MTPNRRRLSHHPCRILPGICSSSPRTIHELQLLNSSRTAMPTFGDLSDFRYAAASPHITCDPACISHNTGFSLDADFIYSPFQAHIFRKGIGIQVFVANSTLDRTFWQHALSLIALRGSRILVEVDDEHTEASFFCNPRSLTWPSPALGLAPVHFTCRGLLPDVLGDPNQLLWMRVDSRRVATSSYGWPRLWDHDDGRMPQRPSNKGHRVLMGQEKGQVCSPAAAWQSLSRFASKFLSELHLTRCGDDRTDPHHRRGGNC